MIIRQVKNLTQTGTIKKLTCAYEELCLCAPSNMAFDTPATHLMYYNAVADPEWIRQKVVHLRIK
ncbi:hypothetical protein DSO57_1035969 [Entomophthora muscae]|uniref:Uncharacterized protein n=1 Tax=Entomophthora muscae TaxID=34485 RepID=A0ACC2UL06_9FUNG|nr:hypothetical protein DSO57_1035969 [Entomophthora muscae]